MLEAVLADFARIPGCRPVTTRDVRLAELQMADVEIHSVHDRAAEAALFRRLAAECEFSLVIAPEFDGLLVNRLSTLASAGGRSFNASIAAVELCGDKLALAAHLERSGVATIRTILDIEGARAAARGASRERPAGLSTSAFPCVLKPRHGAGSTLTFHVENTDELERARLRFHAEAPHWEAIRQPFIKGKPLSAGVLIEPCGRVLVFPAGEQRLSDDGRFRYLGGCLPARLSPETGSAVTELVRRACESVEGLSGFVGVDVLVPDDHPEEPLVVEINPRLTTSYVGYRRLTDENLAGRMLSPERHSAEIEWTTRPLEFSADGRLSIQD